MSDNDALGRLLRAAGRRPPVPPDRERRVRDAARSEWRAAVHRRRATARRGMLRYGLWAAAAVVVAAAAAWMLRDVSPPGGAVPGPARASLAVERISGEPRAMGPAGETALVAGVTLPGPDAIVTPAGALAGLRLPSGHSVRLDGSTRLEWLGERRLRLVRGAVYVDSGGAVAVAGPSLVVETPYGAVAELGTRYQVRLDPGERSVRVSLRDGAIRFSPAAGAAREVVAGREIVVAADGTVVERAIAPDDDAWRWAVRAGPGFELDGSTAAEFVAWAEREHGLRFVYADPAMRSEAEAIRLAGGSIDGLPADEAVALVTASCGWVARESDGVYELRRGPG